MTTLVPAAEYRPDISDFGGTSTKNILNVRPQGDGYGPFPSFAPYAAPLPGPCRGAFYALKSDGSVVTFAATATKLYMLNNTNFTWIDVSVGGGNYASVATTAQWQFAQTGSLVFATQANVVLQVFDLSSATQFSAALGSPPQAAYITVIGGFLVLSGLLSSPYRIMWSGLYSFNSAQSWTAGINSCDFQDFTDGGIVRGVGGGDQSGVIFQDQVIRSMAYVAGSPIIFQIDKIAEGIGLFSPYSIIRRGALIYFYATQGYYKIAPGSAPVPIGRERVDRSFLADLDAASPQYFMGTADPRSSRVYWAYKSISGTIGKYDKLLGYDDALDRFFPVSSSGEFLLGISQSGVTLEQLDALAPTPLRLLSAAATPSGSVYGAGKIRFALDTVDNGTFKIAGQNTITIYGVDGGISAANGTYYASNGNYTIVDGTHLDVNVTYASGYSGAGHIGGSLDALALSLDDYPTSFEPQLGQFDGTNTLGFFSGPSLEATIDSAEQSGDGTRVTARGFVPVTDAAAVACRYVYRDTLQAAPIAGAEQGLSARTGRFDQMRDARFIRFRSRIPAGTTWSFYAGVYPDTVAGGAI
ncbi:hypothetical protein AOQ73_05885 [Bradyrhizobium pachyrhizi]|uniref:hypothetical protein n=1 Tax=Bradyrhizobium pachyrhizi TaxID=280333 RepID=UPI00070506C9|nr:hypothetical protein [Bradyrhizobium pachyrhizi]KRQ11936.1 hypothetical protein AOQ73_05885 [Bradyrhizobium pachyrhizi]